MMMTIVLITTMMIERKPERKTVQTVHRTMIAHREGIQCKIVNLLIDSFMCECSCIVLTDLCTGM